MAGRTKKSSGRASDAAGRREETARTAIAELKARDARLGALIGRIGAYRPAYQADPFLTLVHSITQQQVSMSAAAAIFKRLKALCPRGRVRPAAILALEAGDLRSVGLSWRKAGYVRDLAEHFDTGQLQTRRLRMMSDEEVVEAVTKVKGIGRWTAEMLLMFCLERPDVWPIDDLGVRKAAQAFFELAEMPTASAIRDLADRWRPHRSYATWYLWRSLEGPNMPGIAVA